MFSQASVTRSQGTPLGRDPLGRHPPEDTPLPSACWDTTLCPVHAEIHTALPSACWDTPSPQPLQRRVSILECILVTVCKRSLRRLCFYRCLSVHGGHTWQGGGMHGREACVVGDVSGRGWACMPCMPPSRYYGYGIRSMSGRYASYWNAFLFDIVDTFHKQPDPVFPKFNVPKNSASTMDVLHPL